MQRNTKIKQSIYLDQQLNQEMQVLAKKLQLPKARAISFLLEEAGRQQLKISFGKLRSNQWYVERMG